MVVDAVPPASYLHPLEESKARPWQDGLHLATEASLQAQGSIVSSKPQPQEAV